MAWIGPVIGGVVSAAGGLLSSRSTSKAANGMKYQYMNTSMPGMGWAGTVNGTLTLGGDYNYSRDQNLLRGLGHDALGMYNQSVQNQLGSDFLRNSFLQSNGAPDLGAPAGPNANYITPWGLPNSFFGDQEGFLGNALQAQQLGQGAMQQAMGGMGGNQFLQAGMGMLGPYQQQNFNDLRGNMLSNFDPNQAAQDYTNLLRQQAQPQEQQAAASALNNLFANGRLGTTGGQQAYGQLMQAQNQADISRQVAGQQFGLQQQLMAQQGLDQALNAEQGRQLGAFGANQAGMMNQFGAAQGLANTGMGLLGGAYSNAALAQQMAQGADAFGFNRMMGLNDMGYNRYLQANEANFGRDMALNQMNYDRYAAANNANYNRTQDRFNRALQLFGGENAMTQQHLNNYMGLLGAQQSQQQTLLDLARIGASVGQAQTSAGANAAMLRNQGNQDLYAGFLAAASQFNNINKKQ